jgi:hypothetical protein
VGLWWLGVGGGGGGGGGGRPPPVVQRALSADLVVVTV